MTFLQEFALLFQEMTPIPAICLILGLIFIIVEMFVPGFGFFGITGGILVMVGMAVRIANSGNGNPVTQFFILLLIVLAILGLAFVIMLHSVKRGLLSRTPIVENNTAIPVERSLGTADYQELVGKVGIAITILRPSGVVSIDGRNYDVVANSSFIDKDSLVEVDNTEGGKIIVKLRAESKKTAAAGEEATAEAAVADNEIDPREGLDNITTEGK